jgi:CO/xanthine dehydrogenase Mo-binding subunit
MPQGYTAGSQPIRFGGAAPRLACAKIRCLFLPAAASRLNYAATDLSIMDGEVCRDGQTTGRDYRSLANNVDLTRSPTVGFAIESADDSRVVGYDAARVDLPGKVFGTPIFIHDVKLDGMVHGRVVRQPRRGGGLAHVDEVAIRRSGCPKISPPSHARHRIRRSSNRAGHRLAVLEHA